MTWSHWCSRRPLCTTFVDFQAAGAPDVLHALPLHYKAHFEPLELRRPPCTNIVLQGSTLEPLELRMSSENTCSDENFAYVQHRRQPRGWMRMATLMRTAPRREHGFQHPEMQRCEKAATVSHLAIPDPKRLLGDQRDFQHRELQIPLIWPHAANPSNCPIRRNPRACHVFRMQSDAGLKKCTKPRRRARFHTETPHHAHGA